jgi:hypothetical protein
MLEYRELALAVIRVAVADLRDRHGPTICRLEAQRFLDNDDALGFWCALADIDPDRVRRATLREQAPHDRR